MGLFSLCHLKEIMRYDFMPYKHMEWHRNGSYYIINNKSGSLLKVYVISKYLFPREQSLGNEIRRFVNSKSSA